MAKSNGSKLTAERARELFRYEPETGKLYWRVKRGTRSPGDEAGGAHLINEGWYRLVGADFRVYLSNRVIWLIVTGEWPKGQVDHENGDGLDNRWLNLRDVTNQQNGQNCKISKNNKSGVMGVFWDKDRGKWRARIRVNGKDKHLGLFDNLEDAAAARKEADIKYGYHPNHGRKVA